MGNLIKLNLKMIRIQQRGVLTNLMKYARTSFFIQERSEQNHQGVNPKQAKRGPIRVADLREQGVELVHGKTYMWCACGFSQNQPFCDGSHWKNSTYKPLMFKFDESKKS